MATVEDRVRNYIWLAQSATVSVIVHLVPIHLEERAPH